MRPDYIYAARRHGPVSAVAAAQKCTIKPGALILHHFMYLDDGRSALPLDGRAPVHTPPGRAPCRGQGGSRAHVASLFLIRAALIGFVQALPELLIVVFSLMADSQNGKRLSILDFKQRHVAYRAK